MSSARRLHMVGSSGRLDAIGRRWAFIRHVPARKIARRIGLDVKRRVLARVAPKALTVAGSAIPVAVMPPPIMPARRGRLATTPEGYRFRFLNRDRVLQAPIGWAVASGDRRDQLWSMNLHYMEYLEECDDATFTAIVADWLTANVPYGPGYWRDVWNSYALSLRVVVWMQQLAMRPALDAGLRRRMHESLAGQLCFLERNLETDLGGNHLVKNMKALIWGSACFAGAAADRWRHCGLDLLDEILTEQILADGVHDERSASYHAQVFVDLLECRAALGVDPTRGRLDAALARMAQAVADLTHADGMPVLFNDSGLSMSYAPADCLAACARVLGHAPSARAVLAYPQAGYFGLRAGFDTFVADCGPIAPDALPAHGHGDVLSFEWSVAGRRIVVDQGVFEYVAGPRRVASRSCAHHNTLSIEGSDQAEFFGDFRVGRRPRTEVRDFREHTDGFDLEGAHDGFRQIGGGPVHVRRFEATLDRVRVLDRLEGEAHGRVRQGILLEPTVEVAISGETALLTSGDVRIEVRSDVLLAIEPAVWWPDFGVEIATSRLVAVWPDGLRQAALEFHVLKRGGTRAG